MNEMRRETGYNALDGLFEMLPEDLLGVLAGSNESTFVTHVRDVGTGETGCQCGQLPRQTVLIRRRFIRYRLQGLQVHFED